MPEKQRLDVYLVQQGFLPSREKARACIKQGLVFVNDTAARKAGQLVCSCDIIELKETEKFVGRGGYKLQKALDIFPICLTGAICMDIGASTGGFTDCMLQAGAERVYAIDVGHGQLARALQEDSRVVNLEGVNFRYMEPERIPEAITFASVDVSFISLTLLFPALAACLQAGAQAVCLVKPQFEAGRQAIGKKGIVKDQGVHRSVLEAVCKAANENEFSVLQLDYSPIRGQQGNVEYLLHIKKGADSGATAVDIAATVEAAHLHSLQ